MSLAKNELQASSRGMQHSNIPRNTQGKTQKISHLGLPKL